jgi:hypothetical protein
MTLLTGFTLIYELWNNVPDLAAMSISARHAKCGDGTTHLEVHNNTRIW